MKTSDIFRKRGFNHDTLTRRFFSIKAKKEIQSETQF